MANTKTTYPTSTIGPAYFTTKGDKNPQVISWKQVYELITKNPRIEAITREARQYRDQGNPQAYSNTKARAGAITPAPSTPSTANSPSPTNHPYPSALLRHSFGIPSGWVREKGVKTSNIYRPKTEGPPSEVRSLTTEVIKQKNIMPYLSKTELAMRYYPEATKATARCNFSKELNQNTALLEALYATGYRKSQKVLNPKQVCLIFHYLGNP